MLKEYTTFSDACAGSTAHSKTAATATPATKRAEPKLSIVHSSMLKFLA
jgi:hypothetical protein